MLSALTLPITAGLVHESAHCSFHRFCRIQSLYWKPNAMIRISRPIPARKIKLVIFDLDGTLIDSERDLAAAVNAMLVKYGRKELPIDVIGTYIGDGAPMLIRRALGDPADREFLQEALNYFLLYYREHKLDSTYMYDGIREALQQIGGNDGVRRADGGADQQTGTRVARYSRRTWAGGQLLPGLRRQQLRDQEARSARRATP